MKNTELITKQEAMQYFSEVAQNDLDINKALTEIMAAVNNQAEILGLLRYTITRYLPEKHLEEAAGDYKTMREKQIADAAKQEGVLNASQGPAEA